MTDSLKTKVCGKCKKVFATDEDYLDGTSRWIMDSQEALYFNCQCGSTLMLPKGRYPWYNPALNMSPEASGILNTLLVQNKFPRVPSVMFEFEQLLKSENLSSKALADCVIKDPFFSASLIRLANLRTNEQEENKIKSLEHAISILGRTTLASLISLAILQRLTLKTQFFTDKILWTEIFSFGHLCVKISSMYKSLHFSMQEDEAFLLGALASSVGKMVSSAYFPDQTDAVYMRSILPGKHITWREAEKELSAHSHTTLGEIAGVLWGFPPFVLFHIRTYIDDIREDFYLEDFLRSNILRLAINLGKVLLGSSAEGYKKNYEKAATNLGFTSEDIAKIKAEIAPQLKRIHDEVEPFLTVTDVP